jgi:hypothetical protein
MPLMAAARSHSELVAELAASIAVVAGLRRCGRSRQSAGAGFET